jgi:hypothetical protein
MQRSRAGRREKALPKQRLRERLSYVIDLLPGR